MKAFMEKSIQGLLKQNEERQASIEEIRQNLRSQNGHEGFLMCQLEAYTNQIPLVNIQKLRQLYDTDLAYWEKTHEKAELEALEVCQKIQDMKEA